MSLYDAPLSRGFVDQALPWLRGAFGLLFVGYSSASTIIFLAADLLWLFAATQKTSIEGTFKDAYWISCIAAFVIFIGEIATAERWPKVYRIFLAPDTFYSPKGMQAALAGALRARR